MWGWDDEARNMRNGFEEFIARRMGVLEAVTRGCCGHDWKRGRDIDMWERCSDSCAAAGLAAGLHREKQCRVGCCRSKEGYDDRPAKKQPLGLNLAQKLRVIELVVQQSNWLFAKSLEKLRRKTRGKGVRWAPMMLFVTSDCEIRSSRGRKWSAWRSQHCPRQARYSLVKLGAHTKMVLG